MGHEIKDDLCQNRCKTRKKIGMLQISSVTKCQKERENFYKDQTDTRKDQEKKKEIDMVVMTE